MKYKVQYMLFKKYVNNLHRRLQFFSTFQSKRPFLMGWKQNSCTTLYIIINKSCARTVSNPIASYRHYSCIKFTIHSNDAQVILTKSIFKLILKVYVYIKPSWILVILESI